MIEIHLAGGTTSVIAEIAVVRVVLDDEDTGFVEPIQNRIGHGCFAGPCSAGNADHERVHNEKIILSKKESNAGAAS